MLSDTSYYVVITLQSPGFSSGQTIGLTSKWDIVNDPRSGHRHTSGQASVNSDLPSATGDSQQSGCPGESNVIYYLWRQWAASYESEREINVIPRRFLSTQMSVCWRWLKSDVTWGNRQQRRVVTESYPRNLSPPTHVCTHTKHRTLDARWSSTPNKELSIPSRHTYCYSS